MTSGILRVALVALIGCTWQVKTQKLNRDGKNVCTKLFSYNSYVPVRASYTGYENYRTCCKKFLGMCTSRCTKYRTRTLYYYKNVLNVKYGTSIFCCSGWAKKGSECPVAICTPVCQNGDCISPGVCKCKKGFTGKQCEIEINECNATPKPCQQVCTNLPGSYACSCQKGYRKIGTDAQAKGCENVNECAVSNRTCKCAVSSPYCKATCVDTIGSYRCQCNKGFRLIANKVCTDVDECQAGQHNCEQICVNDRGGFKCACNVGYWLRGDQRSCYDLNECRSANGGCEQQCQNIPGSYKCSCRSGFRLMYDKTRCQDVDECITTRPCDKFRGQCANTFGSYKCGCDKGYELTSDYHTCKDLNECNRINDCEHTCHNSDGSYFCSCRTGFKLAYDKRKCIDIDECKEGTHNCEQLCRNIHGSFRCSCRKEFVLHSDKKTCKPIPCKNLYKPEHGVMKCTGNNAGDTCTFSCDEGYELDGTPVKRCLSNSRWSDEKTRCRPMRCPSLYPPVNGALFLPCVEEYSSKCIVKCKRGYLLEGNPIISCGVKNSKANWTDYSVTCKALNLCNPNPCFNGGKCRPLSQQTYECNCEKTGFDGKNCEVGMFRLPKYPQLVSGVESDTLTIHAKPHKDISITPEAVNGQVTFTPSTISFVTPQVEARFKVLATGRGLIRVTYKVSGTDRLLFAQPRDNILYVVNMTPADHLPTVPNTTFIDANCQKLTLDQCPNKETINLVSSCPWVNNGTSGYQSVQYKDIKLPLSLAGLTLASFRRPSWSYNVDGVLSATKETAGMMNRGLRACAGSACSSSSFGVSEHNYVIQANLFLKSFLEQRNELSPWWFRVNTIEAYDGFHVNNIQSLVLKAERMSQLTSCTFPKKLEGIYVTNVNFAPLDFKLLTSKTTIRKPYPTCVAVDVCGAMSFVSFPRGSAIDLSETLRSLGVNSLTIKIKGLGSRVALATSKVMVCQPRRDVYNFNESKACVNSMIWLPLDLEYKSTNYTLSLRGQVHVEPHSMDKFVLQPFTSESKGVYSGEMKAKFSFTTGGRKFTIDVFDATASSRGSFSFGGVTGDQCDVCSKRGVELVTKDSKVDFYPSSSLATFHPAKGSAIYFALRKNIAGGRLEKIADLSRFQLYVRSMARSIPVSLQSLVVSLRVLKSKYPAEYSTLDKLKVTMATKLNDLQNKVKTPSPLFKEVYTSVEDILAVKMQTEDTLRLLQARILKFGTSPFPSAAFLGRIKFLKLSLKQMTTRLSIKPVYQPAQELDSGFSLSYDGILCFHALCFGRLKASVHNLSPDCNNCNFKVADEEDHLFVHGVFAEKRTYRGVISVQKDGVITAKVHKYKDEFSLSFSATLLAFGRPMSVRVFVDRKTIRIPLTGMVIDKYLKSDFEILAHISERTRWNTVSFELKGDIQNAALFHKELETFGSNYVRKTQTVTRERLEKAKKRVNATTHELHVQEKILRERKGELKAKSDEYSKARYDYLRSVAKYNRTLIQFRSYRVGQFFKNLEKTLDKECVFKTCKTVCLSVPTCDICQAPVYADADTLKCEQKERSVITSVEEPLKTKCHLTRYTFTPIYTGTCKKGKSNKLTGALVGTAAGVGTLAGMAIAGPVGAAIGGAIGTVVGYVGSLFSSCDESYEVHKQVHNIQLPCTRKVFNPRTKRWTESVCYTKVVKVFSTYDLPEECNCNNGTNGKCIQTTDPVCIKDNQECRREREVLVRKAMESAGAYNNSYFELNAADEDMQEAFFKMKKADQDNVEARKSFERQVAIEKKHRLDAKFANLSMKNSHDGLRLEKCLMALGEKVKSAKVLVSEKVHFESRALRPLDLLLKMDIKSHDGTLYRENYLVYDFQDRELSMRRGAEKFVRNMYCKQHTRKRRSLDTAKQLHTSSFDPSHVSGFSSSLISSRENISEATAACLVFTRTAGFLTSAYEALNSKLTAAIMRKKELDVSMKSIGDAIKKNFGASGTKVAKAQILLLQNMEKQALRLSQSETGSNIYNSWLTDMEVFSTASNVSSCTSFEDCVEEARSELLNLPSMFKGGREAFTANLKALEAKIRVLQFGLTSLSTQPVDNILSILTDVKSKSLHCNQVPQVRLLEREKVEGKLGVTVTFNCEAVSDLPVWYEWFHNGTMMPGEHGKQLLVEVDEDSVGRYECEATSKAGKNRSADSFLIVGQSPKVFIDPQNFTHHSSMDTKIVPSFECNVTAEPEATIKWYKRAFGSTGRDVLLQYTSLAISFANPTAADAGWYFCEAKNQHGTARSRLARFDVIASNVPNQALEVKFDMEVSKDGIPEKSDYEKRVRVTGELKASDSVNVSMKFQGDKKVNLGIKITNDVRSELKKTLRRVRRDASDSAHNGASDLDILKKISETRQTLASSLDKVVSKMTSRTRRSVSSSLSESLQNSLELSFDGDLCPDGHQLHTNGFTCVECLPGYFEHQRVCQKCPVGTYQPNAGEDTCLPCKDDQITASDGSSSKDDCISPTLQSTDVIFVLDASASISASSWKKILDFVSNFVQLYFDPAKNIRIGVIVYASIAELRIPLRSYSKADLIRRIGALIHQGGLTRTYKALDLARKQFLYAKSAGNKQLAVVLTDGKSTPVAGIQGQVFTRKRAMELRKSGARIFSVGIGGQEDPLELLSMASFPKKGNTVRLANFNALSGYATKIVALSQRGICSIPTTDIAIVVDLSQRVGVKQLGNIKIYLTGLLNGLQNLDYNIGLLAMGSSVKLLREFSPMRTESDVKNALDKLILTNEQEDARCGLEKVYNEYLTEKYQSLAQRKVILFLTEEAFEEGSLYTLKRNYPEEDITLYNVLLTLNQVEEDIENLGVGGQRSIFSLSQPSELIDEIKSGQGELC